MRRHINYANVVATLALVFAMSGGALAAKHYLVTKTNQISPKVLKSFTATNTALYKKLSKSVIVTNAANAAKAGSATTAGTASNATTATNATNAANATNATNAANATKAATASNAEKLGGVDPSGYQASTLKSGQSEVGTYATWGIGGGYLGTSINYRIPLGGALDASHVHFLKENSAPTPECPGKYATPSAASGNLCLYETGTGNSTYASIFPQSSGSGDGSDTYGFGIYFNTTGTGGAWDYGTWAVTG
jgi:hypothetical protein